MNADQLLQHFDRISEAPDAVARLRRFVLDLAVRGKLVAQVAADEPAGELLKRIQEEKARLVKKGEIRRSKPLAPVSGAAIPFALPDGWAWSRLGDLGKSVNNAISDGPFGSKLKRSHYVEQPGYRVIRLGNIGLGEFKDSDRSYVTAEHFESLSAYHLVENDLVVASLGNPAGRACLIPENCLPALNKADCFRVRLHSLISPQYARIVMNSPTGTQRAGELKRGDTRGRINLTHLRNTPFPLPPLAEQHRIVAKVDELMAVCDELEQAQTTRENRRDRLVAATLHRLNNPDTEPESGPTFKQAASFYINHLPRLTTKPEHIQQLRQTILNLAVRGKLVEQDPRDESATELFARIKGRRETMVRDLGIRERPPIQVPNGVDSLFSVPRSWLWCVVDQCFLVTGGIQKTPKRAPGDNAFPYVGVAQVHRGSLDLSAVKEFQLETGELQRYKLIAEDLLVVEGNGSETEIGRCARWADQIPDCVHQNHNYSMPPSSTWRQLVCGAVLEL